jgi:transcriptional regulator with XRE-family HTH domain
MVAMSDIDLRRAVEAAMASKSWNQAELARRAAVDEGTVGDLLSGARRPRRDTLAKIEQALGWPAGRAAALRDGSGDVVPTDEHQRPALNIDENAYRDLSPEQLSELEHRLNAEAWRARREMLGG